MTLRSISLTLPLPPSSNRYWRTIGYIDKRTRKPTAATFVSDEAKEYKQKIQSRNDQAPLTGDLAVTVRVFRKIRSGDLDNKLKVLFDALQGVAYISDSQIVEIHAHRDDSPSNPRVEIEITELTNALQGLFDSKQEEK